MVPALCAALLLGGCSSAPASRSIIMAAPPQNKLSESPAEAAASSPATLSTAQDEAMALSTVTAALSGAYAGGENGCYTLVTYSDGSADILYFDYAAQTMTLLENPQNPEQGYKGRVQNCWGGVSPMLYGENLYLFQLGGTAALVAANGDAGLAAIIKLDVDGANPQSLSFPAGWRFCLSSAVLCDSTFFYFLMADEADGATLLIKMDTAATAYEAIYRYEPGYEYNIEGFWEMGPLVVAASPLPPLSDPEFNTYWENREFRLLAQGMNTGLQKELLVWNQGQPGNAQGHIFYYWKGDDDALYALNADTGEETAVASGFAPSDYVQAQLMRTTLDGKLRIQFSTNRTTRDFSVDPATGEVRETPIGNLGDNVTVCAQGNAGFLVRNGEHWVASDKVPDFVTGAAVSPTNPNWVSMPQYALISPENYWAGTKKFTEIADMVYG